MIPTTYFETVNEAQKQRAAHTEIFLVDMSV